MLFLCGQEGCFDIERTSVRVGLPSSFKNKEGQYQYERRTGQGLKAPVEQGGAISI